MMVVLKQKTQVAQFPLILKNKELCLQVLADKKTFPVNSEM